MKVLSLIQPWASLIMDKRKTIETRSWKTNYRGILAIHASAKIDRDYARKFYFSSMPRSLLKMSILKASLPTSAIVGIVRLVDCVQFPNPKAPPDEYGDFTPGRYGWLFTDVKKLENPISVKGHLGLWNYLEEVVIF